jgi:hypothetical protein
LRATARRSSHSGAPIGTLRVIDRDAELSQQRSRGCDALACEHRLWWRHIGAFPAPFQGCRLSWAHSIRQPEEMMRDLTGDPYEITDFIH